MELRIRIRNENINVSKKIDGSHDKYFWSASIVILLITEICVTSLLAFIILNILLHL